MSNAEILRAATSVAALACGVEALTGTVCEGLEADLLVVAGSPLASLDALRQQLAVVCRGELLEACQGDRTPAWAARSARCPCVSTK